MRKTITTIFCLLSLFTTICIAQQEPLANENKDGLYAKSIEQVLRLEPEQIDIGTAALIVSEQWSDMVGGRRYQQMLDDMALEIRSRLKTKGLKANQQAIPVINEYLFEELGFKSVKEADDPNDLFLHCVLDKKQGYCLSLSILYLAIGERLGISLYGVVVPGHFFVRYDDGNVRFNIETTSSGGTAIDEHYIKKFKVSQSRDGNIYMTNLNPLQALGCFFNNLGNSYLAVNNDKQALASFVKAVQINPALAEARANLGNMYLKQGHTDEAINEYRLALKLSPEDAKVFNNLGNAYAQKDLIDQAITQYNHSIKLDPNLADSYRNLSIMYSRKKLFERSLVNIDKAISLEPKNHDLYLQKGEIYRETKECEKAIIEFKKAVDLKPDFAEAFYRIGLCCRDTGLFEEETAAYKKAIFLKPDFLPAINALGNAYFNKKMFDEAIEQYKLAAKMEPREATVHYNIGAAYSNKQEHEKAVEAYLKAVELNPSMGDAHYGLAYSYYNLKDYKSSLKHLQISEKLGVQIDQQLLSAVEEMLKQTKE